jgi:hypothetical protein
MTNLDKNLNQRLSRSKKKLKSRIRHKTRI